MIKNRTNNKFDIQDFNVINTWGDDVINKTQAHTLLKEIKLIKPPQEILLSSVKNKSLRLDMGDTRLMEFTFLLIGEKGESQWPLVLERALSPLGKLWIVPENELMQVLVQKYYDAIIIDAGAAHDARGLISLLKEQQPKARIVVATASPTWQRAREMLQAGAVDYIYKSLDEKRLLSEFRTMLEIPLSP